MLIHRSPAFTAVYNEIKNSDRNRVLDLGPMSQGCFQLFSNLSCKIQVENIAGEIYEHVSDRGGDISTFDITSKLGSYREEEKFDVILAWDLFNYLPLSQISLLFEHLQPFCKPDTIVHCLRYVEKKIPSSPRTISVKDQYLLDVSDDEVTERKVPIYSTLELLSAMPGYFMQDTLMGQMGMLPGITEHVMRFEPSQAARHRIGKSENISTNAAAQSQAKTRKHHSPAIAEVMSLMHSADDLVVLDLGSAANRPSDNIVESSASYYRVDLYSLIERSRSKNEELLNLSVFQYELSKKFDVILAWDLLCYCSTNQLIQLDAMLSSLSHENTFLLTHMYTGKNRPAKPSRFEVQDGNNVLITPNAASVPVQDSITGVSLMRLLQGFNMDNTYAYRAGMDREIIEYIFASRVEALQTNLQQTNT